MNKLQWTHTAKEVSVLHIVYESILDINARTMFPHTPKRQIAEVRTYFVRGNITNIIARVFKIDDDGPYRRTSVLARQPFKYKSDAMNWCEVTARLAND